MSLESRREKVRVFLGIPVSKATLRALATTAEAMRRAAYDAGYQIRWVPPVNYHLTLKFLGSTSAESMSAIRDRLQPRLAELPGFSFTAQGVGAFPDPQNARVVWAGVHDATGALARLTGVVEAELAEIGFAAETRGFHPHVTLGRVKRVDDLSPILGGPSERNFSETRVEAVVLFESIMKSTGSVYEERARFALEGAREGAKERENVRPGL